MKTCQQQGQGRLRTDNTVKPSAARRTSRTAPSAPVQAHVASARAVRRGCRAPDTFLRGGPTGPGTTIASTVRSENDDDMKRNSTD